MSTVLSPELLMEEKQEKQSGQGPSSLLGVHRHLGHVDGDAEFVMKGPERRGHIRSKSLLVAGLRRSNRGPRCPAQLVTAQSEVRRACFQNLRPRAMARSLEGFSWIWDG